jgi:hypothetical protein
MSDWQVGDLALCVNRDPLACESGNRLSHMHTGECAPPLGATRCVIAIGPSRLFYPSPRFRECGCLSLKFSDGTVALAKRCRKIRPDEHEACELEFVKLLKRTKVSA